VTLSLVLRGAYRITIYLTELAVKGAPEKASLNYHLGPAYAYLNEQARAKDHQERASQIGTKFRQADEICEALAQLSKS